METDHVKMLCNIGELNGLFEQTSIIDLLQKIVDMVSEHMNAKVCSIYLYDETTEELVLRATKGLKPESVNTVRMKLGEGICGLALKELRPIREEVATLHPFFKFYPGINEELYEAFLAVPIVRGRVRIGVCVVQREKKNPFTDRDMMAMKATASQLASMLENIKLLMTAGSGPEIKEKKFDFSKYRFLKGKSASKGTALAPAAVINIEKEDQIFLRTSFKTYTIQDFLDAVSATKKQLEEMQKKVEEKLSDAASLIFASHLLMLKDPGFIGGMTDLISKGVNPPEAVIALYKKYHGIFSSSTSSLIQEKVQDIEDLVKRILLNMTAEEIDSHQFKDHILIARELYPSEILKMSAQEIAGAVLVTGGVTSHVSFLARSLQVPLIFIDEPELLNMAEDTTLLLDADVGNLYVNPSKEIIDNYKKNEQASSAHAAQDDSLRGPAVTSDGHRITIMVNINLLSDITHIGKDEIDGIGLYRTEFPFIIRSSFPSEEEQYFIYRRLVHDMKGKPVTIRTLDIGGDKVLSYYDMPREENPFLGMRSIRFSLRHLDIFKQQIRAILRAGEGSVLRIMFPMISSLEEFILSRDIVHECIGELKNEAIPHNSGPAIGLMVEIPSAVNIITHLAREADFISVGTNDLIQYTLAVDRTNEKVSDLYVPHHPAILGSLKRIADACKEAGKDVSICGDMASSELYIPFLLGIGMHSLSVDSAYIPRIKKKISQVSLKDSRRLAKKMLSSARLTEIEEILYT